MNQVAVSVSRARELFMSRPDPSRDSLNVTVVSPEGDVTDRRVFPTRESVSIGRSVESDISLADFGKKVSRCHAVLLHDGTSWEYYNLGVNGTFSNGRRVDTLTISAPTVVRLGKTGPILQFRVGQNAVEDSAARDELSSEPSDSDSNPRAEDDVTEWIRRVKDGDEEAAQLIWNRYAQEVVDVAARSFGDASKRVSDEEDVALLALKSLLAGITAGRFPELDSREQLWRLLMVITTRKAAAIIEHNSRQKRGGGNVRGDSAVEFSLATSDPSFVVGFDKLPSEKPAPDLAALMADETHRLLSSLPDAMAQQIAVMKMEGHTHEEIADKLGCNVRTIERRLKQIRELWQKRIDAE
ncbi:FHA domain-containing protein [bacterium]|nr:FHA domain-containing protein [bacterium]